MRSYQLWTMSFCTARRASLRTLGSSCVIIPMTLTLHPRFSNTLETKEYTSCMKSWLIFAASIRNLSGCEIKARKKTSGLNGIWTHDLFDTGAVQYCFTCPLVEHTLVTMNNVAVVLNRSNEPATIERISLRFNLLAQTDYIWFQRQCESLIDVTFLSK